MNRSCRKPRIFSALGLCMIAGAGWAAGLPPQVAQLQDRWAVITYQLPKPQRVVALEALAQQSDQVRHALPDDADALIWDGIVRSSLAGEKGGLGALAQVKRARSDFEEAIKRAPRALDGAAYTSWVRCITRYLAGRSDSVTMPRRAPCSIKAWRSTLTDWTVITSSATSCATRRTGLARRRPSRRPRPQRRVLAGKLPMPAAARNWPPSWQMCGRSLPSSEQTSRLHCMRILLVEDDLSLGEGIRTALRRAAYAVDWVHDGVSALMALQEQTMDLVILDLGLPRMDGIEVIRTARARAVDTPILVLSARERAADRALGPDVGADDYLASRSTPMNCWRARGPCCGARPGARSLHCRPAHCGWIRLACRCAGMAAIWI